MKLGLRVDVDTFRGTKLGVPRLVEILGSHGIRATFFFTVGPDNMGRHLFRLLRPAFLVKMLRSNAPGLYGWDIVLRGTLWPGPGIGKRLAPVIRAAAAAGHECGLHAWDHHAWQTRVATMPPARLQGEMEKGYRLLTTILGQPPVCAAAPGWRMTEAALDARAAFPFRFNSDCRGESIFLPVVAGEPLAQPQIPTTLPTYDEVIGRDGMSPAGYNEFLLSRCREDRLNVLTIHAEVEGISCAPLFTRFIELAQGRGMRFAPLGELLDETEGIGRATIAPGTVPGREGWVACQASL